MKKLKRVNKRISEANCYLLGQISTKRMSFITSYINDEEYSTLYYEFYDNNDIVVFFINKDYSVIHLNSRIVDALVTKYKLKEYSIKKVILKVIGVYLKKDFLYKFKNWNFNLKYNELRKN